MTKPQLRAVRLQVRAYAADRITREESAAVAAGGTARGFAADMARATVLPAGTISAIRTNETKGVGEDVGSKLAAFWNMKGGWEELKREAKAWAEAHPEKSPMLRATVVESSQRFAHLEEAIRHARAMGLLERAIEDTRAESYQLAEDKPVRWWFDKIQERERWLLHFAEKKHGRSMDDDEGA